MEGSIQRRRRTARQLVRDLGQRAHMGEVYGFIECLSLLYKNGVLDKAAVAQAMNERGITHADLELYKRTHL